MIAELILAAPEIALFTLACVVLIVEAFNKDPQHLLTYWMTQISLVTTLVLIFISYPENNTYTAFSNTFINDAMSATLKIFICGISMVVFFYSYEYLKEQKLLKGEYFVLGLYAVLGMMVMASAANLLLIYLGLELLSLSLYAMVAMQRNSDSASEVAIKYFILGALASGMLLYGISMIYGITGHLQLTEIAKAITDDSIERSYLIFGTIFLIVGIAFKLGAVPFHMWMPDVYQGTTTSVTLFISTAPKLAALAMAIRILVDGLLPLRDDWQLILMVLAVLSMAIGNIIAIAQTNIKRMLAYSTIAHVGYLLLGLIAGTLAGFSASMFYVISYAVMSLGGFGMIILLTRQGFQAEMLDDYKGLVERNPWFAFIMLCLMFSMAGIPPFLGFWSKWFVLSELVNAGFVTLAAVAVVFSIIGAYFYLRIIKLIYFDKATSMTAIKASSRMRMVLSVNGLLVLVIGIAPDSLMNLCIAALTK